MKLISIGSDHDTENESVKAHIIDTIGEEVWRQLVRNFGGLEIAIPQHEASLHSGHDLVAALGMEQAVAIVRQFFGETIYIHNPRRDRVRDYAAAMNEGLDNTQIARRFRVSERWVRHVLSRAGIRNPNRKATRFRHAATFLPDDPEFIRRARVWRRYVNGDIATKTLAAQSLSISVATFTTFIERHRPQLEDYLATRGRSVSTSTRFTPSTGPADAFRAGRSDAF